MQGRGRRDRRNAARCWVVIVVATIALAPAQPGSPSPVPIRAAGRVPHLTGAQGLGRALLAASEAATDGIPSPQHPGVSHAR